MLYSFLSTDSAVYIRQNTLRIQDCEFNEVMGKYGIKPVGWYAHAYRCDYPDLARTLEYSRGYFYIQGLSSMVPVLLLDLAPNDVLLDISAAPGSKATQAAMHMQNSGVIVANDISYNRLKSLGSHIDRLGILNIALSNCDGRKMPRVAVFSKAIVDVPCSSFGSRKASRQHYSENRIRSLARLQKQLLLRAYDLVAEGGTLVYSTCTTTVEENEMVVAALLEKRPTAKLVEVQLPFESNRGNSGISEVDAYVARFELDEAFFVSKIIKGKE